MDRITVRGFNETEYKSIVKTAQKNGESKGEYCKRQILKSIPVESCRKLCPSGSDRIEINGFDTSLKKELIEIAYDNGYTTLAAFLRARLARIVENEGRI